MTKRWTERLGCPDEPPGWLDRWPGLEVLGERFTPGIRGYVSRVMRAEKAPRLRWDDNRLVLQLDAQQVTWRVAGESWTPRCTCGFRKGECAHAYAALKLFQEVAEECGWLGASTPDEANAQRGGRGRMSAEGPRRRSRPTDVEGLPLFDRVPKQEAASLVVEVDVHHEPGTMVLRFFRQAETGDRERSWLTIQGLYNLCRRAGNGRLDTWPERDVRFMTWLGGRIGGRVRRRRDVKVVKLSPEDFERWQDTWEQDPGRFIERSSQKPFHRDSKAALHFELNPKGERVEIAAMVTLSDGRCVPYHHLVAKLSDVSNEFLLDGHLIHFEPPVSKTLLAEAFARKSPTMAREHVVRYLPDLLEQRLDLVRGDAVKRTSKTVPASVALEAAGADFVGRITLAGQPFRPRTGLAAARIEAMGERFRVQLFETECRDALREFLRAVNAELQNEGRFRVSGTLGNARALVEAWNRLPDTVEKHASSDLRTLFEGVGAAEAEVTLHGREAAVEFDVFWRCGDRLMTAGEMRDLFQSERGIVRTTSGQWLRIDERDAEETARRFQEVQGMVEASLLIPEARRAVARLQETPGIEVQGLDKDERTRLLQASAPPIPAVPDSLAGILRSYQKAGFNFLAERVAFRTGALLADDMGLGKTLQVLAVLEALRQQGGLPAFGDGSDGGRGHSPRVLVVCPASVVGVWTGEAARFCPNLPCRAYQGPPEARASILADEGWSVLVANYAIVRQDVVNLSDVSFDLVVLDEAQTIKNPQAQTTKAIKSLQRKCGLALTGTPLENRALDLWSISDFLNPGFLGNKEDFEEAFGGGNPESPARLAARIRPVLLRRTKGEVAAELPPLTQEVLTIEMDDEQRRAYVEQLALARERAKTRGAMEILAALTRLRQVCCHPDLLERYRGLPSAKLDTLLSMLEEITVEGHSALVFSQFVGMLDLVEPRLEQAGLNSYRITGDTPVPRRGELVKQFNEDPDPAVFLLSLKAAGTGLTLTRADYVFIYDPWWNPAVERQAIDRTHRIGQDSPVMAYRMIAGDSVEEKVLALQSEKAELFRQIVGAAEGGMPQGLTQDDLVALLA